METLHLLHVPPSVVLLMALLSLVFVEFIGTECEDQIMMNFSSNTILYHESQ